MFYLCSFLVHLKHIPLFLQLLIVRTPFLVLSIFILSSFSFPCLRCHPNFYLNLFVCYFPFPSLGCHPRFYLCSILVPYLFWAKLSRLFLCCIIILVPTKFLLVFVFSSFGFLRIGFYPRFLSMFNVIFFGFQSLWSHPRFSL